MLRQLQAILHHWAHKDSVDGKLGDWPNLLVVEEPRDTSQCLEALPAISRIFAVLSLAKLGTEIVELFHRGNRLAIY